MREFSLLEDYPKLDKPRYVSKNQRTIEHRIVASKRGEDFFDGDRNCGYGGFKYDGRWKKIAKKIVQEYKLVEKSKILQLGCEKGFLLNDLMDIHPNLELQGLETSEYAIRKSMDKIKKNILKVDNYLNLNFEDNYFDFVLGLGVIYVNNLTDAIRCISEIERVSNGKSFISLASYTKPEDYWLFKSWSVLGTTILKKEEWIKVLKHVKYSGDYYFVNSDTLNIAFTKNNDI